MTDLAAKVAAKRMAEMTIEEYFKLLPQKTHNGEPYGFTLRSCNENEWSMSYHSNFSNTVDDRFGICIAKDPKSALDMMVVKMVEVDSLLLNYD